jgi:hypothetical protein
MLMSKVEKRRERCDRCKKWVAMGELFFLPEEVHSILKGVDEFNVCDACVKKHSIEKWIEWVSKAREEGLSYKDWKGK